MIHRWWLLAVLAALPTAVSADAPEVVDLAIVVSLDRSRSIDTADAEAQINGLIFTLRQTAFANVVAGGRQGRIGLSVVTWSSFGHHETILPWVQIAGPDDAELAVSILEADFLRQKVARHGSLTDVALAIEVGIDQLAELPWTASRQVINIVADGVSNIRRLAAVDRDDALARGITINGLIMAHGDAIERLAEYFRSEVIGGPNSFLQVSTSNEDFANAMLRKMLLEMVRLRQPMVPTDKVAGWRCRVDYSVTELCDSSRRVKRQR